MVAELHRVYSAKNKAYGLFSEESELAQTLRLQRQGEEDFLAFSRAATGRLRDELAKYPFADGGFVLFCHYRYLAVEYLLVAVLSNLSSMRVNENLVQSIKIQISYFWMKPQMPLMPKTRRL